MQETSVGQAGQPPGLADRQRGFLAPLVRRSRRVHRPLGGDSRSRRLRLPAHRFAVHRRHDDHAAAAADGSVRRLPRCHRRTHGAAHHADHRRRQHGDHIADSGDPGTSASAGRLAPRGRELHQRHRLGDRQSGAAGDDRRGGRRHTDGHRHVGRCWRQQRQPHDRPNDRRPAARRRWHRRRVHVERCACTPSRWWLRAACAIGTAIHRAQRNQ